MEIPDIPQVFFIKGVFKQTRCIQEIIIDKIDDDNKQIVLLKYYEDFNDSAWLAQPEVQCAICRNVITGRHKFIPQIIENVSKHKGLRYKVYGDTVRFDHWWCAAYYIQYFIKNDDRLKLLLNQIFEKWEGYKVVEILPSQHPWRLIECGGEQTLEQYHKLNEFNFDRFKTTFDYRET